MLTTYQIACRNARNAGWLFLHYARVSPGFSSPANLPGLGLFHCPETGLEIVLTRAGLVDARATKARRKEKAKEKAIAAIDAEGREQDEPEFGAATLAEHVADQEEITNACAAGECDHAECRIRDEEITDAARKTRA